MPVLNFFIRFDFGLTKSCTRSTNLINKLIVLASQYTPDLVDADLNEIQFWRYEFGEISKHVRPNRINI